jgi:tetratricopeptide (TPR) repeat protein
MLRMCAAAFVILVMMFGRVSADPAKAKLAYERGITAYNLQRFDDALAMFQRAYEEKQDAALLFNIGQCQRQLGQYDAAARSYRAYLNQSADAPNREDVARLLEQVDRAARESRDRPRSTSRSASATASPPESTQTTVVAEHPRRPWYKSPAGMALTSLGIAGGVTGAALLGVAASDASSARDAMTLPDQRRFNHDAGAFSTAGIVTIASGAAFIVVGGVLLAVRR